MKARIQQLKSNDPNATLLIRNHKAYGISAPERQERPQPNDMRCELYVVKPANIEDPTKELSLNKLYLIQDSFGFSFSIDKLESITLDSFENETHYIYRNTRGEVVNIEEMEEIIGTSEDLLGIPYIHKCFVDAYIRNYNAGTKINDVWVEECINNSVIGPKVLPNECIIISRYRPEAKPKVNSKTEDDLGKIRLIKEIVKDPAPKVSDEKKLDDQLSIDSLIDAYVDLLKELDNYKEPKEEEKLEITKIQITETSTYREMKIEVDVPDDMDEFELLQDESVANLINTFIN